MRKLLTILLLLVSLQVCYADPLNPEDETTDTNKEYTVEEVFGLPKNEDITTQQQTQQTQSQPQTQRIGPAKRFGNILKAGAKAIIIYGASGGF